MSDLFKIIPMGGVGEIGSNFTLVETANHTIYLDYGILFPYDDFFDINYLIVDIDELNQEKEKTLFITHGHEDHIGAIVHFVQKYPGTQIYAPRFAKELITLKLEAAKLPIKIKEYDSSDSFEFDQLNFKPLHVTHSIPDTHGVIIQDKSIDHAVLFISDFKYDLNPLYENPFDIEKIKKEFLPYTKRTALLDSTNILVDAKTTSESELTSSFEKIFQKNKRTFVTLFSSNIYRVKNILDSAKKEKRKISTIGRSVKRYLEAAEKCGIIDLADYPIVDFDGVQNYTDKKMVYIVTGSQGEFLGALRRIVNGDQKNILPDENDLFVFSSKPIPGNEKKIYQIYNQISEYGSEIITSRDMKIHASGHPGKKDLEQLIKVANPTHYVPIHGETYFLRKHIEFINETFPQTKTIYLENFQGLDLSHKNERQILVEQKDPLLIHGRGVEIEREKISERRKLACNGLIIVSINLKQKKIEITKQGLPNFINEHDLKFKDYIHFTVFQELKNRDYDYTKEQVRIKARSFFKEMLGYKPIAIIHIL